jgi:hypothetical protein
VHHVEDIGGGLALAGGCPFARRRLGAVDAINQGAYFGAIGRRFAVDCDRAEEAGGDLRLGVAHRRGGKESAGGEQEPEGPG